MNELYEHEINEALRLLALFFACLDARTKVIDLSDLRTLRDTLTSIANGLEADRARAARFDDEEGKRITSVQAAVIREGLNMVPMPKEDSATRPFFDEAVRVVRSRLYGA